MFPMPKILKVWEHGLLRPVMGATQQAPPRKTFVPIKLQRLMRAEARVIQKMELERAIERERGQLLSFEREAKQRMRGLS